MGNSSSEFLDEVVRRTHGSGSAFVSPHSAEQALESWGNIDIARVDVGHFAQRIQAAKQPFPVRDAEPVCLIKDAHDRHVRVIVWDPFRDLLVSGGRDGWIRFWDAVSYTAAGGFDSKVGVRSLLVLAKELVSGHGNGEVCVWGILSKEPKLQTLTAHKRPVYSLTMLQTGELVTGAEDIKIWKNYQAGYQLMHSIPEDSLCICCIPCSMQVVTGSENSLLSVWDTNANTTTWKVIARCQGHQRAVWSVCYVNEVARCVSGSADRNIRVWETERWTCEHVLQAHEGWVVGFCYTPGCLLSCGNDHLVRAWEPSSWNCQRTFAADTNAQYSVYSVCALGGGRFALGGTNKSIVLYGGEEHGWREVLGPANAQTRWTGGPETDGCTGGYRRQLCTVEDCELYSDDEATPVQRRESSAASSFATLSSARSRLSSLSDPTPRRQNRECRLDAIDEPHWSRGMSQDQDTCKGMSLYDLLGQSEKKCARERIPEPMHSVKPVNLDERFLHAQT